MRAPVPASVRARNVARLCLEMAAEAEKVGDHRMANDWRAEAAKCLRITGGKSLSDQSLGDNVIQLFG